MDLCCTDNYNIMSRVDVGTLRPSLVIYSLRLVAFSQRLIHETIIHICIHCNLSQLNTNIFSEFVSACFPEFRVYFYRLPHSTFSRLVSLGSFCRMFAVGSPQGDVKSYLRCCQAADPEPPEAFVLQRMACEIAAGLLHLHKHNFIHRYTPNTR